MIQRQGWGEAYTYTEQTCAIRVYIIEYIHTVYTCMTYQSKNAAHSLYTELDGGNITSGYIQAPGMNDVWSGVQSRLKGTVQFMWYI